MTAAARRDGPIPAAPTVPSAPDVRWRQVYRGEEAQIRELRRWIAGLLPECAAREDVVTVTVELATNAIQHTASGRDGWFAVEIVWHRSNVLVLVGDQGAPSGPRLADDADPLSESGRGLRVVHGLSARTGVVGDRRGRLVWAEVPWASGSAPEPPGFPAGHEAAIRYEQDLLARRHVGVLAWFGRATFQWWAMVGNSQTPW